MGAFRHWRQSWSAFQLRCSSRAAANAPSLQPRPRPAPSQSCATSAPTRSKRGLVASLSRPGGNITGINILTSELATKRVGLLHDLVPSASVFAHLVNPNFPSTENIIEEVDKAAQLLGLKTVVLKAVSKAEIDTAFAAIQEKRIG